MRMKTLMSKCQVLMYEYNNEALFLYRSVIAVICLLASLFYGNLGITNPFFLLACFFTMRMFIDFEDAKNGMVKERMFFGVAKSLTSVLIVSFGLPVDHIGGIPLDNLGWWLIWVTVSGAFLCAGVKDFSYLACILWSRAKEEKEFAKEMKDVAETARTENAVVADLTHFLAGIYPQEENNG